MANRINPARVFCPLVNAKIDAADCIETQDCAEGLLDSGSLQPKYVQDPDWKTLCGNCEYHESE